VTTASDYRAYLKEASSTSAHQSHFLTPERSTIVGRELTCEIVIDSNRYPTISRRHLEIRPVVTPGNPPQWLACDLGSGNGSFVNQQRLSGCQELRNGDVVQLGDGNLQFIFELQVIPSIPPISPPVPPQSSLQLSQLLPVFSSEQSILKIPYLVPGIFTVFLVIGLFITSSIPGLFNFLLGTYLGVAGFYVVYLIAGKKKPWWIFIVSAIITIVLLVSPLLNIFIFFFRKILPGDIESNNFFISLMSYFFGAGLLEELFKAIPIFIFMGIGRLLPTPWREKIGVWEPLDGILIGAASAVGFTLLETLAQYVPQVVSAAGAANGELRGLQLLLPRIIGQVAGHVAYSGYFGYFIGLSVLKPRQWFLILTIGYLTSSILHAFWNAAGTISILVNIVAGILGYTFLLAAISKARRLSPNKPS
jgi:RsiW-degrading membrane proteinase PrsW (M82 family)